MNRFSLSNAALCAAAVMSLASVAGANSYIVGPGDLATSKAQFVPHNGSGTNPFGSDFDSVAPSYASGAPAGYGNNSMTANVVNGNGGPNPGNRYQSFRVSPAYLTGGTSLTVGDLSSFSWDSLQLSGSNTWRISIYTEPTDVATDPTDAAQSGGDAAKWYGSRIQAFPTTGVLNTWQTLSSAGLGSMFSENNLTTPLANASWSQIQGAIGSQKIMFIDFTLGADNGGGTEAAQLDAITFNYGTRGSDSINLESVPLPTSAWMGLGLMGLLGLSRFRKPATV